MSVPASITLRSLLRKRLLLSCPLEGGGICVLGAISYFEKGRFEWTGEMTPDDLPLGFIDCGLGNLQHCGNQGSVGDLMSWEMVEDGNVQDPRSVMVSNIEAQTEDELILGYEREIGDSGNWAFGMQFRHREMRELVEDFSLDHALNEVYGLCAPEAPCLEYRLGNPGSGFDGFVDLDGDGVLDPVHFSRRELGYPRPDRNYEGLEFSLRRRFSGHWMLQASYTWSHLNGNTEGSVDSDSGADNADLTVNFDAPGIMEYSSGDLPGDHRHNLKIFGSYVFDSGFQIGWNFNSFSGRPLSAYGGYPREEDLAFFYSHASHFNMGRPVPRGSVGRTPAITNFDLMFRYAFGPWGLDLDARIDVFNLFNASNPTNVN